MVPEARVPRNGRGVGAFQGKPHSSVLRPSAGLHAGGHPEPEGSPTMCECLKAKDLQACPERRSLQRCRVTEVKGGDQERPGPRERGAVAVGTKHFLADVRRYSSARCRHAGLRVTYLDAPTSSSSCMSLRGAQSNCAPPSSIGGAAMRAPRSHSPLRQLPLAAIHMRISSPTVVRQTHPLVILARASSRRSRLGKVQSPLGPDDKVGLENDPSAG